MAASRRPLALRSLHPRLRWDRRAVAAVLRLLEARFGPLSAGAEAPGPGRELSVVFLDDPALARIHADFMDDPSPTDVITFPAQPDSAGEICVSADAARRRVPRGDFSAELTLYLVHGWLHLAGHDDRTAGPRRAMRRAEARAMAILRRAGPLPAFSFQPSARRG